MDHSSVLTCDKELEIPNLSEWPFQSLADHLPDAVLILNAAMRICYHNLAVESMFGYSASELIGQSLDLFIPDPVIQFHRSHTQGFMAEENAAQQMGGNQLVHGKHHDGHLIPLDISINRLGVRHQKFAICILRDISHLIDQQQALSESEQRYRGIIESQDALVVRVDRQGRFTFANQAYCEMFGKNPAELVGQSFSPLVHPDDLPITLEAMKGLERPPYRINVEQRAMTVRGWRWIAWEDCVIQDEFRNLYEIQGVGRDITEQKRTEEINLIERDLAIILAQKSTMIEALPLCLDLAIQVSDMDSGGIYLTDPASGNLILRKHTGLSDAFIALTSHVIKGSPRHQLASKGIPVYQGYQKIQESKNLIAIQEEVRSFASIPVQFNGKLIATLNIASHTKDDIPEIRRLALENLAMQMGNMITRFQVQDELTESQFQLQSIFDSLMDFVFVLDDEGQIIQVNQVVLDRLGYLREELIGQNVLAVHPPEQREHARQIVSDMLNGLVDTCPIDLLSKDGAYIPVETKVARGRFGNQDVLIGISRDITEHKAAEDERMRQTELLAYRNQFEEILTTISTRFINLPYSEINLQINQVIKQIGEFEQVDRSYVFLIDEQTHLLRNSHEWCAPGVEPQIENLQNVPSGILPWWMNKLEKLEEVYIPIVSQLPAEAHAEREILEAQSIQSLIVVPMAVNHELIGFLGFDSVVHQRYWSPDSILLIKMVGEILSNAIVRTQMENDLRQSESQNRALLSAIPDLIFRIRRDGTFLDFKSTSDELLLLPPDQIVGASLRTILDDMVTAQAITCIEKALQSGQVQTLEYTAKIGDASHVFEARFKNSGVDEVIAIIREISERARLEQMKSDFINHATHELRTPIATMLLMVNLIDGEPDKEEYTEYWDVMKSELNRERLLVEDLLTAGRLESDRAQFHFRPIDVHEIINQVIQTFEMSAREKKITISLESKLEEQDAPDQVQADENAISQVFSNLVGNALKFTPAHGNLRILLQRAESGIKISFIDNGIGIPSEDLPMLFNRFFRGTNAIVDEIQGTGIGLFIVRSILEKHGGKIQVSSELGIGSQFDVWLPLENI